MLRLKLLSLVLAWPKSGENKDLNLGLVPIINGAVPSPCNVTTRPPWHGTAPRRSTVPRKVRHPVFGAPLFSRYFAIDALERPCLDMDHERIILLLLLRRWMKKKQKQEILGKSVYFYNEPRRWSFQKEICRAKIKWERELFWLF